MRGNPKVNSVFVAEVLDTWHKAQHEKPKGDIYKEEEEEKIAKPKKASCDETSSSGTEADIEETRISG